MTLAALQNYLKDHDIESFTATEITLLRSWGKNHVPSKDLWPNIIPTLAVAEIIRAAWAELVDDPRIRVNSGIRPDDYNRYVGGGESSEHKEFKALDLSPMNGMISKFKMVVVAVVTSLRLCGEWNIGLGIYNTFIHIDTNAVGKRVNRTWDLQS